jgi:hypothetical protein
MIKKSMKFQNTIKDINFTISCDKNFISYIISIEDQRENKLFKLDENRSVSLSKKTITFYNHKDEELIYKATYPHRFNNYDKSELIYLLFENRTMIISANLIYYFDNQIYQANNYDHYDGDLFYNTRFEGRRSLFFNFHFKKDVHIFIYDDRYYYVFEKDSVLECTFDWNYKNKLSKNCFILNEIIYIFNDKLYRFSKNGSKFLNIDTDEIVEGLLLDSLTNIKDFHKQFETLTEKFLSYFVENDPILKIKQD